MTTKQSYGKNDYLTDFHTVTLMAQFDTEIIEQWVAVSDPVRDLQEAHLYEQLSQAVRDSWIQASTLYRGTARKFIEGSHIDYSQRLSSWSTDKAVAEAFAGDGVVLV